MPAELTEANADPVFYHGECLIQGRITYGAKKMPVIKRLGFNKLDRLFEKRLFAFDAVSVHF